MNIGDFEIGPDRVFVIAEACSNIIKHTNELEQIVVQTAETGADALKVQLFSANHFPPEERSIKRKTEFPRQTFSYLVDLCHVAGIYCGASVFDENAIKTVKDAGGDFLKLATREYNNYWLLDSCLDSDLPLFFSYDYRKAYWSNRGKESAMAMACVPEYPADNIRMKELSGMGWSSHTWHWLDCLLAVSRGSWAIEKHIMFDPEDYEAGWSLDPQQFKQMVKDIRWTERAR